MRVIWGVKDDEELPGRSLLYLMQHGMTRGEAADVVARVFDLDESKRQGLLAA